MKPWCFRKDLTIPHTFDKVLVFFFFLTTWLSAVYFIIPLSHCHWEECYTHCSSCVGNEAVRKCDDRLRISSTWLRSALLLKARAFLLLVLLFTVLAYRYLSHSYTSWHLHNRCLTHRESECSWDWNSDIGVPLNYSFLKWCLRPCQLCCSVTYTSLKITVLCEIVQ